jgi:hypothetical protein
MPKPKDYVDVAERIRQFYERFPDGRLTSRTPWVMELGERTFVCVHAKAFRTPDDPIPGDGLAWEPVPGPTPFTRDSELMNAETSAWGRAIVALGFETKNIASADEVRNRQRTAESVSADLEDVPEGIMPQPPTDDEAERFKESQRQRLNKKVRDLARLTSDDETVWRRKIKLHITNFHCAADYDQLDAAQRQELLEYADRLMEKEQAKQPA